MCAVQLLMHILKYLENAGVGRQAAPGQQHAVSTATPFPACFGGSTRRVPPPHPAPPSASAGHPSRRAPGDCESAEATVLGACFDGSPSLHPSSPRHVFMTAVWVGATRCSRTLCLVHAAPTRVCGATTTLPRSPMPRGCSHHVRKAGV